VTALTETWAADEPFDLRGRDLEGALVRRERTSLRCAAASLEKLGPWERTAVRQAARKLLLAAAAQVAARD